MPYIYWDSVQGEIISGIGDDTLRDLKLFVFTITRNSVNIDVAPYVINTSHSKLCELKTIVIESYVRHNKEYQMEYERLCYK